MSDTTEFPAGAAPAPGETPLGRPASSGNAGSEGSPAGSTAPALPAGCRSSLQAGSPPIRQINTSSEKMGPNDYRGVSVLVTESLPHSNLIRPTY